MVDKEKIKEIFGLITDKQIELLALAFPLHAKNPKLFTMSEQSVLDYAKNILTDFAGFTEEEQIIVFSELTAYNQSIIDSIQPSIEGEVEQNG